MVDAPSPHPDRLDQSGLRLVVSRARALLSRLDRRAVSLGVIMVASLMAATDAGFHALNDGNRDPLGLFSLSDLGPSASGDTDADGPDFLVNAGAFVVQQGENNLARIVGFGPVNALVSQFGQDNQVEMLQNGSSLVSVVEQGRAPGTTSLFDADLLIGRSGTDPFGGVSGNRAFIDQAGVNNTSLVGQFGSGGLVDVTQAGSGNLSRIFQSGNDASAFVTQTGERNSSDIRQHDFSVRANIVQTGEDGLSEARQWDQSSGSEVRVYQAGSRAMSDIDQGGVRNLAMVVQYDQSDRVSSTVIQDGNLGQARVDQAGFELVSIVRQISGERNQSEVYQAGLDNVSEISQAGIANIAVARQSSSGNRSTIVQTGSGNTATVSQSAL